MTGFFRLLLSRWCLTLLGTALFCGVVWYLGPLLPELEDWRVRAAAEYARPAWWVYGYSLLYLALLFVAMAVDRHLIR